MALTLFVDIILMACSPVLAINTLCPFCKTVRALNITVPTQTTSEYDIYETGTFCTPDSNIAMEKIWWAPKNVDSCNFIIQRLRVFSYDGLSHSGVAICETFDWDLPNDDPGYPTNSGGYDAIHRLVYTRGTDTDVVGCQPNNTRYGGTAMIGSYINDSTTMDTLTGPYSAYLLDNETYLFPYTGWDAYVTDGIIQNPGYGILGDSADMNTIMTYFYNYTINPAETLYIYSVITTVENGLAPSADKAGEDLIANIQKAKQWTSDHVIPLAPSDYVCGDANGDGSSNLGDAGFIINYIFYDGPAPNPMGSGDANADGGVNLGDAGYIINYIFYDGQAPVCP